MEAKNIIQVLTEKSRFNSLLRMLKTAGLTEQLENEDEKYTLFAPNDRAIQLLSDETLSHLLDDPELLKDTLEYHLVSGVVTGEELKDYTEIATVQGDDLAIEKKENDGILINDAELVTPNIKAENGVIHEIDRVLTR